MKTASWEISAGSLLAFLNGTTALQMADLYTFTTPAGAVYRYTSGDTALTVNGKTFLLGPKLDRTTTKSAVGIAVDTLTVDAWAETSVTLGGVPFVQALGVGALDGATVLLERAFMQSGVVQGTVVLFVGRVGEVQTERGHVTIEVLSHLELLDVMIPSGVYQPSCRNTLFDLNCGLARSAYKISKTASNATDAQRLFFTAALAGTPGATSGYLALGKAVCTSGANAGVSRTIKSCSANVVTVIAPWPYAVTAGDAFDFYPGCDKTKATCSAKYSNLVAFEGEPFVPLPDMVI